MMPCIWPNILRTPPSTTKKVTPISGSTSSTASASFQFSHSSSALAAMITKIEEITEATVWATKVLMASTSEVRLVSSFAGVIASTAA